MAQHHQASDEMDALLAKVEAVAAVNSDSLAQIAQLHGKEVVTGYTFSLSFDSKAERSEGDGWHLRATPHATALDTRLESWRYDGESLEEASDVFNDKLDLSIRSHSDVARLNDGLLAIARKWGNIARDTPPNRAELRKFLLNLERVQVAVGQLHELTFDTADPLSADADVLAGMDQLVEGFQRVKTKILDLSVTVDGSAVVGTAAPAAERIAGIVHDFKRNQPGYTVLYDEPYSHATKLRLLREQSAGYEFVVLGAYQSGQDVLRLAAGGPPEQIFQETSSRSAAHEVNEAFWYAYPNKAVGFAGTSLVDLHFADVVGVNTDETRLSWFVGNGRGGWRAGAACDLHASTEWRKIMLGASKR